MSSFDPLAFLDAQQTEVNVERPKIPEGIYVALIGEIAAEKIKTGTYPKGDNIGNPWMSLPVPLKLQLPGEVQAIGLPPEFQLTDNVFIDLTPMGAPDNAKGKNRRQKDYRDATGLNKIGEPFSWRMLTGRMVKVQVKHEIYEGRTIEKPGLILPA